MSRRQGFTLVELLVAASVTGVLLLAGVLTTKSALQLTTDSLAAAHTTDQVHDALDEIEQVLSAAGGSTVEYVLPGAVDDEDMDDDAVIQTAAQKAQANDKSDNVLFRRVVMGPGGNAVHYPPPGRAPMSVYLKSRGPHTDLVYYDGRVTRTLMNNVSALEFEHLDGAVVVNLEILRSEGLARKPRLRKVQRTALIRLP